MKTLLTHSLVAALTLGLSTAAFAAETKTKKTAAPAAAPATDTGKKQTEKPEAPAAEKKTRALPMNARVDSMDAAAKTFTMKRKDGVEIVNKVTEKTEIMNGGVAAKFEDIKMGDMVAGSRMKKSEGEYEVVKITKFGPAAPKKAKMEPKTEAKPAEKMEEKKP